MGGCWLCDPFMEQHLFNPCPELDELPEVDFLGRSLLDLEWGLNETKYKKPYGKRMDKRYCARHQAP